MLSTPRTLNDGEQVQIKVELDPADIEAMGLTLPEGQPSAVLLVSLSMVKLQGMMRRALTNKGRRATLDGCMLVVEPLGAVPFPEPEPDDHGRRRTPEGRS